MRSKILKSIFSIIICILMLFTFSANVFANSYSDIPKNRTLIVNAEVDPRVSAESLSVTIFFVSSANGYQETITLTKSNNYTANIKTINSEFYLFSGMVSNDLMGNYVVRCDRFDTKKATTTVTVIVGDPDYSGEVVESENLIGDIDRATTDALREQHGLPPIDWEKIDEQIANGEFDLNKWIEDDKEEFKEIMIDKGYITEDVDIEKWDTDGDGTPNYYDDDDDNDGVHDLYDENPLEYDEPETTEEKKEPTEDKDGDGDLDEDDLEIEQKEEEEQKKQEEEKSRGIAIAFVCGMILVFVLALYFRNKYSDLE